MPANNTSRPTYRPWLWLGLAFGLSFAAAGRWTIPLATWIAPIFMLRFVRLQSPLRGYLIGVAVSAVAGVFTWKGLIPVSGVAYYGFIGAGALIGFLPYLADRLATQHLRGVAATLVFPTAVTTLEYVLSFGDYGTWGATAYTQQNLALLQLTSVTGLWGITFLIYWLAAVINEAWNQGFTWARVRRPVSLYAGVLALVLLGGSARLEFAAPRSATFQAATVTGTRHAGNFLSTMRLEPRAAFRDTTRTILQDYLRRSRAAAQAGAHLVAWPEAALAVAQEDEPAFIDAGRALAQSEDLYLVMALAVFPPDFPETLLENKLVWITPAGTATTTFLKARPVPGEPSVPGGGPIPITETPWGRGASAICFDMDHHRLLRQAGQADADWILAPSNDWKAIADIHAHMARFRAIENGASLIRPTSNGLSLAVDYQGRTLAHMDHFTAENHVMMAHVPIRGTSTLYATIGDLFAWLCGMGLALLLVAAFRYSRTNQPGDIDAPPPTPDTPKSEPYVTAS